MPHPVKIVAILNARPGKTGELETLLTGMALASREEPGNLRWDIWCDHANQACFVLDELYDDLAAVTAHRDTPHFRHYLSHINDLAERTAFVLDAADLG